MKKTLIALLGIALVGTILPAPAVQAGTTSSASSTQKKEDKKKKKDEKKKPSGGFLGMFGGKKNATRTAATAAGVTAVGATAASAANAKPVYGQADPKLEYVWAADHTVIVSQPNSTIAREKGFKVKRGTRLKVGLDPRGHIKKEKYYYYVRVDDSERYPFVGGDVVNPGYNNSGYVSFSAVNTKAPNFIKQALVVDYLYVKTAGLKLYAGPKGSQLAKAPLKLKKETRLWAVTGTKEKGTQRYQVELDDWRKYPQETRAAVKFYVEDKDVTRLKPLF